MSTSHPMHSSQSLSEVHETIDPSLQKKGWKRLMAFIGPAYLVSVGYMDPGNWATDLQGGARFGYQLIWILLMSNLMALLLQSLAARLGIVRRRDLAQANREVYPPVVNFCLYLLAELAIAACDLAEVLGMAIGIHLLTGLPVLWGVIVTVLDTFLLFYLQRLGMRKMEAFIIALVAVIGVSFLVEVVMAKPHMGDVVKGLIPTKLNTEALYIAVGIIGATVMPHNLYLHSALVQTRKINNNPQGIKQALKFNTIDSSIALNVAFLVNTAILVLAAAVFFTTGNQGIAKIEDAHQLLEPMLGTRLAPLLFAIALIAAGQSSTVTGTLAGQIVMEGYLRLRINPLLRRFLTRMLAIVPAVLVITIMGEEKLDDLLVFSQVVLSLQLGFAIIPLIHFVSDKTTMGEFAIRWHVKILAWMVAAVLIFLNVRLVVQSSFDSYAQPGHTLIKIVISIAWLLFAWLFVTMTFLPLVQKHRRNANISLHKPERPLVNLSIQQINVIAVALDFGIGDEKLIANAIAQGKKEAVYYLLHIVETVSARYLGDKADDYETRSDSAQLEQYAAQLRNMGYHVETRLGYKNRVQEIVRIVQAANAGMLVMGAHRHTGIKDWIYGETVNQVRHKLAIPILIVS